MPVDIVTADMFDSLINVQAAPAVSIYLPTHRVGPEIQQDPIRLRNLLQDARGRLAAEGMRGPEADALLRPVAALVGDSPFWQHQEDGLALFVASDRFELFRLPVAFPEFVEVAETFHLKPLLPVLSRGERFYVLALSQQQVRLLWGTRYRVGHVDLTGVPKSMAEALWFEDLERQVQFHQTGTRGLGRLTATFHGQGMGKDVSSKRLERFFRIIDKGITGIIEVDAPVVLAGVDFLLAVYRRVSEHPVILDEAISGNPEELGAEALHRRAWAVVEPFFRRERDAAVAAFSAGSRPTETTIEAILPAASGGRVAALFVAEGSNQWGVFRGSVERHEKRAQGDRDLFALAVAETWRRRGAVYLMPASEIPGGRDTAATLRY